MFLSRPLRFGKSLLTNTFHSYFEGRKELFEGLAIAGLETEWIAYSVLHFDMSMAKHMDEKRLKQMLDYMLSEYERKYNCGIADTDANVRLANLIKRAFEQTNRQVVVLIDEYDAPLLDLIHEEKNLPTLRNVMRNFYSPTLPEGYITIKDYDARLDLYTLDIPNKEVRLGLMESLLPHYVPSTEADRLNLAIIFREASREIPYRAGML